MPSVLAKPAARYLRRLLAVLVMGLLGAVALADAPTVERLRTALYTDDLLAFQHELDTGRIGPELFSIDAMAYDVLCTSTHPDRTLFLEALLTFGIDPSTENPEQVPYTFTPLACAYGEDGVASFERLLDAGANSNISVCPSCADCFHTLVNHILILPELFDMITERRELTQLELDNVAFALRTMRNNKRWKGQPLNEYYADYLRKRGYPVVLHEPMESDGQD